MPAIDINKFRKTMLGNDKTAFEVLRDPATGLQTSDEIEWVVARNSEFRYENITRFPPPLARIANIIKTSYIPLEGSTFKVKKHASFLKFEFTPPIDPSMDGNPLVKLELVPISEWGLISRPLEIQIGEPDVKVQLQLTSTILDDWRGFYMQSVANFTVTLPTNQDESGFQIRWGCNNRV